MLFYFTMTYIFLYLFSGIRDTHKGAQPSEGAVVRARGGDFGAQGRKKQHQGMSFSAILKISRETFCSNLLLIKNGIRILFYQCLIITITKSNHTYYFKIEFKIINIKSRAKYCKEFV